MALWKTGMMSVCPNCPSSSTKKRAADSVDLRGQAQVVPVVPRLWVRGSACSHYAWLLAESGQEITA
jgi:hypothetical protein